MHQQSWVIMIMACVVIAILIHHIFELHQELKFVCSENRSLEYDLKVTEKQVEQVEKSYDALLDGAIARGFIRETKTGFAWTRKENGMPVIPKNSSLKVVKND